MKGGTIVRSTYDKDDNCEIVYQIERKGLGRALRAARPISESEISDGLQYAAQTAAYFYVCVLVPIGSDRGLNISETCMVRDGKGRWFSAQIKERFSALFFSY